MICVHNARRDKTVAQFFERVVKILPTSGSMAALAIWNRMTQPARITQGGGQTVDWAEEMTKIGWRVARPEVGLFRRMAESGCGTAGHKQHAPRGQKISARTQIFRGGGKTLPMELRGIPAKPSRRLAACPTSELIAAMAGSAQITPPRRNAAPRRPLSRENRHCHYAIALNAMSARAVA